MCYPFTKRRRYYIGATIRGIRGYGRPHVLTTNTCTGRLSFVLLIVSPNGPAGSAYHKGPFELIPIVVVWIAQINARTPSASTCLITIIHCNNYLSANCISSIKKINHESDLNFDLEINWNQIFVLLSRIPNTFWNKFSINELISLKIRYYHEKLLSLLKLIGIHLRPCACKY